MSPKTGKGTPTMNYATFSAAEFVTSLGDTLEDWALGADWTVTVLTDGTVNALDAHGVAYYDLAAGNPEAAARVIEAVAQ